MDAIKPIMESRISRAQLKPGTEYIKIKQVNGVNKEENVGVFVCSYHMGSGDGMTCHWEFKKDGIITTFDDEMWGSVSGSELIWYRELPSTSTR